VGRIGVIAVDMPARCFLVLDAGCPWKVFRIFWPTCTHTNTHPEI